jgi:hypothetical protein
MPSLKPNSGSDAALLSCNFSSNLGAKTFVSYSFAFSKASFSLSVNSKDVGSPEP